MHPDIEAQIERAKQLLAELEAQITTDLNQVQVSSQTRNLTQEVLVKMRSILDQVMLQFFDKHIAPHLTEVERQDARKRVYFPIVSKKEDLKAKLGQCKIRDLDTQYSSVYQFLDSVQPYNSGYLWMADFQTFSNDRHVRLTPQTKSVTDALEIKSQFGKVIIRRGSMINTGNGFGASILGKRLASGQNMTATSDKILFKDKPDDLKAQRYIWVAFLLDGTKTNALWLCRTVVEEVETILNRFYVILPELWASDRFR